MELTEDAVSGFFPDAAYLVLSSRLVPDLDGGYTIATVARARQMAARGADVQLLTVDPADAAAHDAHREEFAGRGMLPAEVPLRNLFDEAVAPGGGAAPWLQDAVDAAGADADADADADAPADADPTVGRRVLSDPQGRPFLALPVIAGDPDWHLSRAAVDVFDERGAVVGSLPGFGALYRAWLSWLAAESARPVVVICESRQLGELLAGWSRPGVRIVHMIHTMHLEPPYTPDAPVNALWTRWFVLSDRFDAVVWPTRSQRDAVAARFGSGARNLVAPNGVEMPHRGSDETAADVVAPEREPGLVISVSRLAAGKRLDHSIRAFVAADVPGAVFEIWGDGPERERLAALIAELGVGDRVHLRGRTADPAGVLARASVFVTSTAFEGQGLSIVEALAAGVPVVSYDVRFGPGDILAGGGGVLVADGDEAALAEALRMLLTDEQAHARLAEQAYGSARVWSDAAAMSALADVMRTALESPARR